MFSSVLVLNARSSSSNRALKFLSWAWSWKMEISKATTHSSLFLTAPDFLLQCDHQLRLWPEPLQLVFHGRCVGLMWGTIGVGGESKARTAHRYRLQLSFERPDALVSGRNLLQQPLVASRLLFERGGILVTPRRRQYSHLVLLGASHEFVDLLVALAEGVAQR
jgi:hypothetical protein